jgi:hypothetical protein
VVCLKIHNFGLKTGTGKEGPLIGANTRLAAPLWLEERNPALLVSLLVSFREPAGVINMKQAVGMPLAERPTGIQERMELKPYRIPDGVELGLGLIATC